MSTVKVYHIHPRKTGGTALRYLLQEKLQPEHRFPYLSDFHFFSKVPREEQTAAIGASDLISGHFGRLGPLVPKEFARICMLRDPLRRVVSEFNHITNDERDLLHKQIQGKDFCTAVRSKRFARQLSNHQSRMLVENMGEEFDKLTEHQQLDCGIAFLSERVDCLGVLEHPVDFLESLKQRLGIEVPATLRHANCEITAGGVGKETIRDCLKATVTQNSVDLALYSYALAKLGF